jgi:hypothetical protein
MTKFENSQIQSLFTFLPVKMEQIEYSETSAYKIQTPGNYPEENIQHTEHKRKFEIKKIYFVFISPLLFHQCFVTIEYVSFAHPGA